MLLRLNALCLIAPFILLNAQQVHPAAIPVDLSVPFVPPTVDAESERHLLYELHVTNFGSAELTLARIEVLDDRTSAVVASYEDEALKGILARPGSSSLTDRRVLAGGLRAVAFLDLHGPSSSKEPTQLRHRVTFQPVTPPNGPLQSVVEGGRINVPRGIVAPLGPPVEGTGWVASHALSNTSSHRRTLLAIDGRARIAQRFAIDFTRIGADGQVFHGDPAKNENWTPYGAAILAVADGRVVQIQDGIPENDPTADTKAVPITLTSVAGNYLILDLGDGRFALYAHLKPGSLAVRQGSRVRRGQQLARLGNSGQSDAPHLHLHIMDAPSPLAAEGLPLTFETFDLDGHVPSLRVLADGTGWRATEPKTRRRSEMPVENAAVSFPVAGRVELLPKESARSLAIVHVTIIDVRDGTKIPDQTVIIRGSRIDQVGNSRDLHDLEGYSCVCALLPSGSVAAVASDARLIPLRVGIIGLGGVGGYYGGLLARSGVSIHALARGANLEAVRSHGLEIQTPEERWVASVAVSNDASELARSFGPEDFVLVSVKAYSLRDVAPEMKAFAESGATLLPLLNGVDIVDRLVALGIPTEQVLGGVTYISAARVAPFVVARRSSFQRVLVGEIAKGVSPRTERIVEALRTAGADAKVSDNIKVALWQKFVFLTTIAAACGLARSPIGPVRESELGWRMIERALDEAFAVAQARGINFPDDERTRTLASIRALAPSTRPSLLLDLDAGGPTEVDILSGTIARYAKQAGIETPLHETAAAAMSVLR